MPSRGRRVASRQAQVGRKSRRQIRGPSGVPEAGSGTAVAEEEEAAEGGAVVPEVTTPAARVRRYINPWACWPGVVAISIWKICGPSLVTMTSSDFANT